MRLSKKLDDTGFSGSCAFSAILNCAVVSPRSEGVGWQLLHFFDVPRKVTSSNPDFLVVSNFIYTYGMYVGM